MLRGVANAKAKLEKSAFHSRFHLFLNWPFDTEVTKKCHKDVTKCCQKLMKMSVWSCNDTANSIVTELSRVLYHFIYRLPVFHFHSISSDSTALTEACIRKTHRSYEL